MSWDCPHQIGKDPFCERLIKPCQPFQKGCILEGKFKRAGSPVSGGEIGQDWTVGEWVTRYPRLRQRLEQLGIDYCCGGKIRLAEAIRKKGLARDAVLEDLRQTLASLPAEAVAQDWNAVPIGVLADHILEAHHAFLKDQLPRLDALLAKVQKAHALRHGAMLDELRKRFAPLRAELEAHLMKEERILFPAIKGIDAFVAGTGKRPVVPGGSIANPIRQMEAEHENAGDALGAMRTLTGNYTLPDDACPTFAALYEGLAAMEADLHEHIHLENNILFPKSVRREAAMNQTGS